MRRSVVSSGNKAIAAPLSRVVALPNLGGSFLQRLVTERRAAC